MKDKQLFVSDHLLLEKGLCALVGRNGTGKSTFLNVLLNEQAYNGGVKINGQEVSTLSPNERSKLMSIVRAKPLIYGDYSCKDLLMIGRLPYQGVMAIPSKQDYEKIDEVAALLGITQFLERDYNSLSDGEKQLVMVGRAIVQDTPIILLDEPTAFLDVVNRRELMNHLKQLALTFDKLIIFSTHHIDELRQYCQKVLLINKGKLEVLEVPEKFKETIEQSFEII